MDNTLAIVGTLILGVVGVIAFLALQPADQKKRSSSKGMKPRGANPRTHGPACCPRPPRSPHVHSCPVPRGR